MARLDIPQKMKEWSLWALWWLLIGGATLWLLVGSVAYWVLRGWLPPDASGWVQAIGSVLAIAVAIVVAYAGHRMALKIRSEEEDARERGCAARLFMLIWEAKRAAWQLVDQSSRFRNSGVQCPPIRPKEVDFLRRIMERAMKNLDDDLNADRHLIAGRLRFNLSVLIGVMERYMDKPIDDEFHRMVEKAYELFDASFKNMEMKHSWLAELNL
ncbi:hypothetical protein [Ectopseudomonas mendocina]|uniref:hypothetical protein n=1 Tax=Ectopseudomonas mendocina TaxID=300 RepID=UPI003F08264A